MLLLGTLGCRNHDAVLGVAPAVPPGAQVSLALNVQPIFAASCATAGCHAPPLGGPMSLLPEDSYASLVGTAACEAPALKRVAPGSGATSYLVVKLEGNQSYVLSGGGCAAWSLGGASITNCGGRMPLGGPPFLPSAEIQIIRDWIDQGAKNN